MPPTERLIQPPVRGPATPDDPPARVPPTVENDLEILASLAMALGQAARAADAPGGTPRAMLEIVLARLREQLAVTIAWGVLTPDIGGGSRTYLADDLALSGGRETAAALDAALADLAAPLVAGGPRSAFCLTELTADPRTQLLAEQTGIAVLLGVPLVARQVGRTVGALLVGAREFPRALPATLRLLGLVGGQLGTAIDYHTTLHQFRVSEERARLMTEQATDAIYVLDAEGRFTYLNPRVEELLGYSVEELLGQHFAVLIAPHSLPRAREIMRRSAEGEPPPPRYELDLRRRDGEIRTFEFSSTTIYEGGRFIGRSGIARDVTEARRVVRELAQRNRALEALNAIATLAVHGPALTTLLDEALTRTLTVFNLDRGAIFLLDSTSNELVMATYRGYDSALVTLLARLPIDRGIPARAIASDGPVTGRDMAADASRLNEEIREAGIGAYACVALRAQEHVVGLLCVAANADRELPPIDSDTLGVIGAQLGVAIENARLADESARQRAALEVKTAQLSELLTVSAGFAANTPLDEMLTMVARAVCGALGFGSAHIRTRDERGAMVGVGFHGYTDAELAALRVSTPATFYDRLFDERFRVGGVYFIPHTVDRRELLGEDWTVVPQGPAEAWQPGRWHPEDALAAPLRARDGGLIGVIYVDEPADGLVPNQEKLAVLELFARQTALAIENARLYQQAQTLATLAEQRLREREALYRADAELHRSLHVDQVLDALVTVATDILRADKATVMVWDADHTGLVVGAARGFHPETIAELTHAPGEVSAGQVALSGRPVVVPDARADPRVARWLTEREGIHALVQVPIVVNGAVFGVFGVNYCQPRVLGDEEERLLLALAQRAALAIENARLYEQARELAVAEERNRLAHEIHDTLAQGFTGIILQLEVAESFLGQHDPTTVAAREHLLRAQALARTSLQEARRSVWNLRPSPLQGRTLLEALQLHLEEWRQQAGIVASCSFDGTARPLTAEVETALLRVAQEALNNIRKHARASQVELQLVIEPATVRLRVCDDGIGFAGAGQPEAGSGFGLIGMRERASRLGGSFTIASTLGHGTCIEVTVPDTLGSFQGA